MSKDQTVFMPRPDEPANEGTKQVAPLMAAPMAPTPVSVDQGGKKKSGKGKAVAGAAIGVGAAVVAVAAFTGFTEDTDTHGGTGHSGGGIPHPPAVEPVVAPPVGPATSGEMHVAEIDVSGNGKPDGVVIDTNGDGKPNMAVAVVDTTGDGKPDTVIIDIDGDGKPDVSFRIESETDGGGGTDVIEDGTGDPGETQEVTGCTDEGTEEDTNTSEDSDTDIAQPEIEDAHEFVDDFANDSAVEDVAVDM